MFVETCQPANSVSSENWELVTTGGISRLRHVGTRLFLTYPASAQGPVFLAAQSAVTTQGFLQRNEGFL